MCRRDGKMHAYDFSAMNDLKLETHYCAYISTQELICSQ